MTRPTALLALVLLASTGTSAEEYRFYFADHTGSNAVITDRSGQVVTRTVVDSYGGIVHADSPVGPSGPRHFFIGEEFDRESDLHFLNARYYDPAVGRFLATDPELINLGETFSAIESEPASLNTSSYALNRPTVLSDRSGRSPKWLLAPLHPNSANFRFEVQRTFRVGEYIDSVSTIGVLGDMEAVREAFAYLSQSRAGAELIQRVGSMESSTMIRVSTEIAETGAHQVPLIEGRFGTIIEWDPTRGMVTDAGGVQSPAIALAHELGHALFREDVREMLKIKAGPYDDATEFSAIEFIENPIAQSLGEPTRNSHSGELLSVPCVSCN